MKSIALTIALVFAVPCIAHAAEPTVASKPLPMSTIEIFRIAPGQHEAFLESVAHVERISKDLGLPLNELYVHDSGASWDFVLIKRQGMDDKKWAELIKILRSEGYPGGPDYFFWSRKMFASHEDTSAIGPTTATEYLGTRITPTKKD